MSAKQSSWTFWDKSRTTKGRHSGDGSINNNQSQKDSGKEYIKKITSKCSGHELKTISDFVDWAKKTKKDLCAILQQIMDEGDNEKIKKEQNEVDRLLFESREVYSKYLECEPKRNEFYRNAFYGDLGVLNCMKKYCQHIHIELLSAETIEQMRDIVWGNHLQFFIFALEKLNEVSNLYEDSGLEDYGKHWNSYCENPLSSVLKEMLEADKRMLRVEEERKQKRKGYEYAEAQLKEMYPIFEFLKKPDADTSANEYEKKALETKEKFVKILEQFYDKDELNSEGVK